MTNEQYFAANCPTRTIISEITNKWSMMVMCALNDGPRRFNEIKRQLEGISQKSLTQTLRKLERNGIIKREVAEGTPLSVRYSMTEIGSSLHQPFKELYQWTVANKAAVETARQRFDQRQQELSDA